MQEVGTPITNHQLPQNELLDIAHLSLPAPLTSALPHLTCRNSINVPAPPCLTLQPHPPVPSAPQNLPHLKQLGLSDGLLQLLDLFLHPLRYGCPGLKGSQLLAEGCALSIKLPELNQLLLKSLDLSRHGCHWLGRTQGIAQGLCKKRHIHPCQNGRKNDPGRRNSGGPDVKARLCSLVRTGLQVTNPGARPRAAAPCVITSCPRGWRLQAS